VQDRQLLVKEY